MPERSRLLILDVLESYARERSVEVHLERSTDPDEWTCVLPEATTTSRGIGETVRAAILAALRAAGVDLPNFQPESSPD
jgi:hypothetical protein